MQENLVYYLTRGIPAALAGALSYLFGPWDAPIAILLCVVCLDYITGVINAAIHKTVSSAVGFSGLLKKVLIFVLVALAALLDKLVPATNGAVRTAVCMFYIANEGLSILENAGSMGLPLPRALKSALEKLKKEEEPKASS